MRKKRTIVIFVLFITAKLNHLEPRNLSHWIRQGQFTHDTFKNQEKTFFKMIYPLLSFPPDFDTFFRLFTSKKGDSDEKNSHLQSYCILQTTRDNAEEKKIFMLSSLRATFFLSTRY